MSFQIAFSVSVEGTLTNVQTLYFLADTLIYLQDDFHNILIPKYLVVIRPFLVKFWLILKRFFNLITEKKTSQLLRKFKKL